MLESSSGVRFSGVKDIAKVTQAMLEYKMLIRTHHAGIKKECACKLSQFLPLCAYSVLEHNTVLKKIEVVGMLEFNEKRVLEYSIKKC